MLQQHLPCQRCTRTTCPSELSFAVYGALVLTTRCAHKNSDAQTSNTVLIATVPDTSQGNTSLYHVRFRWVCRAGSECVSESIWRIVFGNQWKIYFSVSLAFGSYSSNPTIFAGLEQHIWRMAYESVLPSTHEMNVEWKQWTKASIMFGRCKRNAFAKHFDVGFVGQTCTRFCTLEYTFVTARSFTRPFRWENPSLYTKCLCSEKAWRKSPKHETHNENFDEYVGMRDAWQNNEKIKVTPVSLAFA